MIFYIGLVLIGAGLWISLEMYRAPWYDEKTNTFYKKRKK